MSPCIISTSFMLTDEKSEAEGGQLWTALNALRLMSQQHGRLYLSLDCPRHNVDADIKISIAVSIGLAHYRFYTVSHPTTKNNRSLQQSTATRTMASRSLFSMRAVPARTTTTTTTVFTSSSCPILTIATPVTAHQAASYSSKTDSAPRMTPATEAWIAKLKEVHGFRWQAVYDESRARQARNAELIQEKHRQQQEQKTLAKSSSDSSSITTDSTSSSHPKGKTPQPLQKEESKEGPKERAERVAQTEEAWITLLKARFGEDAWEAVYEQRKAAFEAGLAQSEKVGERVREKSRLEKERLAAERKRAKEARAEGKMLEADMRGPSGPEAERRKQWRDAREQMTFDADLRRPSRPETGRRASFITSERRMGRRPGGEDTSF